jgi:hypothetical protein
MWPVANSRPKKKRFSQDKDVPIFDKFSQFREIKTRDLVLLSREELPLYGNSDLKTTWNSMGDLLTLLEEKDVVLACFD